VTSVEEFAAAGRAFLQARKDAGTLPPASALVDATMLPLPDASFDRVMAKDREGWIALFADRMVGKDFDAGLANLKAVAEKR